MQQIASEAGADDCITKRFDLGNLLETIERYVWLAGTLLRWYPGRDNAQ